MIYFDNAATTFKKPQSVINAVNLALRDYSANPGRSGHFLSNKVSEKIFNIREKIANFFNANSYENVVFTQNCTTSLNIVLNGLFSSGDHILISDLEHNSVTRTVFNLTKKNVQFDIFETAENDEVLINNILKLIKPNTKGIVCTHGSNVFGIKLPIKLIGELCRNNNLLFIVDAAQTAGIEEINIKEWFIDYLCIAPHKGLYAPTGTGILITDKKPQPFIFGGTGSNSMSVNQPEYLPEKYESGTINVPGIFGISAGIDFVNKNKLLIKNHEMKIVNYLYDSFKANKNVILYNKPQLPVLSFNIIGENSTDISNYLNKNNIYVRSGLHCAPLAHFKFGTEEVGTVRISPCIFNNLNEAQRLVSLINKF